MHGIPPRTHKQFEDVVEARGVAAFRPDHGLQQFDVMLPHRRGKRRLARTHRVAIAPERIDLAVVGEQAERLGQRPARQRVGRIALVKDRHRGFEQRRAQIRVKRRQLRTDEERLVNDRAAGERAHKKRREIALSGAALDHAAREVQAALPRGRIERARRRADEQLANGRLAGAGERAEHGRVHRHDAPAKHRHAQAGERFFDDFDGAVESGAGRRQEEHAERDALTRGHAEQLVRDLCENAGAVARMVVRGGAAMGESRDGRQRHAEDVGAALAARASDESDPTGVALAPGVQQTKSPLCGGSGLGGSDCGSCHAIAPRRSLGRPYS